MKIYVTQSWNVLCNRVHIFLDMDAAVYKLVNCIIIAAQISKQ